MPVLRDRCRGVLVYSNHLRCRRDNWTFRSLLLPPQTYALQVMGDNMIEDFITEGM